MANRRLGHAAASLSRLHRPQPHPSLIRSSTAIATPGPFSGKSCRTAMQLFVLCSVLAFGAAACGSRTASPPSTTTSLPAASTTTAPATTTLPPDTTAVLTAYRAEWASYEHALATANPLDPSLAATMVNPLLHEVIGNLVTYHQEGIVGQGSIQLYPRVATLGGTSATVLDCSFSSGFLVYKRTGKQVPPITKPEHDAVKATLVLDGSTWKVKSQDITEGSCPAGY